MIVVIDAIAFDADDTLWHNESLYSAAQERFEELVRAYHHDDGVLDELYATEMANLPLFGYGIKSFTLSMIETAVRLSAGKITAAELGAIVEIAKEMKRAPVSLLDHVEHVIQTLARSHKLMLITKGDLLDQKRKIANSGLAAHFDQVEVVTEKTVEVYRALLVKHRLEPERFLMVGNSLRSDILPVVALGAHAVHIPYHLTWAHETVPVQSDESLGYMELEHIGLLPHYVEQLMRPGALSGARQSSKTKEEAR